MTRVVGTVLVGALVLVASAGVRVAAQDDDLAVVKKAVAPGGAPPRPAAKPQWLKVRVVDKNDKKSKVTINVPIAWVAGLGEREVGLFSRHADSGCKIKLSDVLASLAAGHEFVNIDSEDALIRVWVE